MLNFNYINACNNFARSFYSIKQGNNDKPSGLNIIYLDNSFSMENTGKKVNSFEQTQQIARKLLTVRQVQQKIFLITNDLLLNISIFSDRDAFVEILTKLL